MVLVGALVPCLCLSGDGSRFWRGSDVGLAWVFTSMESVVS